MALASGTSVGLSYVAETTHGVTPDTPSMTSLRSTSRNINGSKNTLESEEVRSDRQKADLRHGFQQVKGSIGYELSLEAYDDFVAATLGDAWAAGASTAATTLNTDAATNAVTRASGSFVSDGYLKGDIVTLAGLGTNDGQYTVVSVSETSLVVAETVADESGDGDETLAVDGMKCGVGTTLTTFSVERRFNDIAKYQVYRGVAVNSMSLQVQPEAIVKGSFDLIGMSFTDFSDTSLGTPSAAPTHSPMSAFSGTLLVEGEPVAVVTSLDLTVSNNRQVQAVVGSDVAPDVFDGQCTVEGTLSVFLESNSAFYSYFYNEAEVSLQLKLVDPAGGWISFFLPRIKPTGGDMDPPQEGAVTVSMPFKALVDETNGLDTIVVQRSNA